MNSPEPKSWQHLAEAARSAPAPSMIDARLAVRRQIEATPRPTLRSPTGLMDELASLLQTGWLRGAVAALLLVSTYSCWHGMDAAFEIAWFYELQGPMLASVENL